jgi:hypothetical protein
MPKIIVQANQSDSDGDRVTLSERVFATHLQDDHYASRLIERLTWAASDAEHLELPTDGEHADERRGRRSTRPSRDTAPSRTVNRPVPSTRRDGP